MIFVNPNEANYHAISLNKIGGKERRVPENFYDVTTKQPTNNFSKWLLPIVGEFKDTYLSLDDVIAKEKIAYEINI